jgi:hypothetical protein
MKLSSFFKQRKLTILDKKSTSALVLAIKEASDKSDYPAFKRYISNAPLDSIVELTHKYPNTRFIQKYVSEFPNSADSHFLYGNYLINQAWQARSNAISKNVSVYQFTTFSRFLNAAHLELCTVLRLNPSYLPAFSLLIKIQRGKHDKRLAQTLYQYAKKTAPELMDYHIERMTMLGSKWGGSSNEMFNFSQQCAYKDPTGILHGVIPAAHFEYWHSLSHNGAHRYITSEKVKNEVKQAYLEVENAVFGEGYYQKYQYYLALNYFALLFLLMNEKEKAKIIFERIDGRYTYRPWANMGDDPGIAYIKYKKLA